MNQLISALIEAPHTASAVRDSSFILKVRKAMRGQPPRRQPDTGTNGLVDGPGFKFVSTLKHKVEVDPVPCMFEQDETHDGVLEA
jgi:hypothetical protein